MRKQACKLIAIVMAFGLGLAACAAPPPEATPTPTETAAQPTPEPIETPTPTEAPQPSPTPAEVADASPTPIDPPSATPAVPFEPVVSLELITEGLTAPLAAVSPRDGSGRILVADQIGQVWIVTAEGERLEDPFLDLRDRMVTLNANYDERGLLGLALHPAYEDNGRLFVYYSAPLQAGGPVGWNHTSHLSEFSASPEDPNRADPDSERVIMRVDQPQSNHNGGQITFGPTGYLYVALGDGGSAHDLGMGHTENLGNGQDPSNLLGSILRIDVDGNEPYEIPSDNPFVGDENRLDEIYAYGLRNPFRMAFDTGGAQQLFAGDVGQNLWEEVNIIVSGGNYGWNIKEGTHCFDPGSPNNPPETCPDSGPRGNTLIDPIIEYPNANLPNGLGRSVIGGKVYRGTALPSFEGRYVFGDWSTDFQRGDGTLFIATPLSEEGELWPFEPLRIADRPNEQLNEFLLSFGQDADGELYVLTSESTGPSGSTGKIYRLVPADTAVE